MFEQDQLLVFTIKLVWKWVILVHCELSLHKIILLFIIQEYMNPLCIFVKENLSPLLELWGMSFYNWIYFQFAYWNPFTMSFLICPPPHYYNILFLSNKTNL